MKSLLSMWALNIVKVITGPSKYRGILVVIMKLARNSWNCVKHNKTDSKWSFCSKPYRTLSLSRHLLWKKKSRRCFLWTNACKQQVLFASDYCYTEIFEKAIIISFPITQVSKQTQLLSVFNGQIDVALLKYSCGYYYIASFWCCDKSIWVLSRWNNKWFIFH